MSNTRKVAYSLVLMCLMALLVVVTAPMAPAYADESSDAQDKLVREIEQSTQTYQEATATVEELSSQIEQSESHIAEVEDALPAQRELAASSIKQLYIFQQSSPGLLELLVSADDFNEFITALQYLDAIHDHNTTQVNALQTMYEDLAQSQAMLTAELDAAMQKQGEALEALDNVRTSLAALRKQSAASNGSANNSQALQQAEKAVATLPETVARAVSQPTSEEAQPQAQAQPSNSTQQQEAPKQEENPIEQEEPEAIEAQLPASSNADTDSWAARIDAYLSSYGAPLAGYGSVFAQAAAEYGVDPRLSPAIAVIESGGGSVCFKPHNAWGWGSASWPDWASAIRGHISGFSRLYGSMLTREGAEAYASMDTWETWYNLLLSEMASI